VPASAVDQYCEMLPTATGGHAPSSSDTKLGGTLPLGLVRATLRSPLGRRLGGLPGRDPESASQAVIPVAGGRVSPWSLSMPLILVLAGLASVLTVIAAGRWRRTRRGAP
jgi:hypothetical protein